MYALLMFLTCRLSGQFNATLTLPELDDQVSGYVDVPIICESINGPVSFIEFHIFNQEPGIYAIDANSFHANFPKTEWNIILSGNETILAWEPPDQMLETINPGTIFCKIRYVYDGSVCRNITWDGSTTSMLGLIGIPFTLSLNDGYVCPPLPSIITWTGAVSDDWFDPGNWDSGTVPTTLDNVEIPPYTPYYPVIYGATAVAKDVVVIYGGFLAILPGGSLTTYGTMSNDGSFIIESDMIGLSGSYINYGEVTGAGIFCFNRQITSFGGYGEWEGWHYISSPVDNFSSTSINDYWLNTWDEPNGQWQHHEGSENWTPTPEMFLGGTEAWSVKLSEGFGCYSNATGTVIEFCSDMFYVGKGPYSSQCTFTPGAGIFEGWNLVGNPYPCSIDPNAIAWDPFMFPAIYYWDSYNLNYTAWAGGIGPNIPPTQGFFVETCGNSTFSLNGNERIHDPGGYFFDEGIENLLILEASGNGFSDKTYIHFNSNATAGLDKNLDARKIKSPVEFVPQLYSKTENEQFTINSLPVSSNVQLCFESGTSGEFIIQTTDNTNLANVILEDLLTGNSCDILSTPYKFNYMPGDDTDRFVLHFNRSVQ